MKWRFALHRGIGFVIERAAKRVEAQGVDADETRQLLINHLLLPRENVASNCLILGARRPFSYLCCSLHKVFKLLEKFKKVPITDDLETLLGRDSSDDRNRRAQTDL